MVDAAQHVLNLLQTLSLRLRQYQHREQHARHTEYGKNPEQGELAEYILQIVSELGDEERDQPAHAHGDSGSLRFHVRCEHLTHHGPWKRTPAYAVYRDEDDQRHDRKPRYGANVRMRNILEEHVQTQGDLEIKDI